MVRRLSNPSIDGYVYLTPNEQREASNWMSEHSDELGSLDDGTYVGGEAIIYGLEEDPETGMLTTPRIENEEAEQDQSRFEMAKDAAWHSELLERTLIKRSIPRYKIKALGEREKKVLYYWFRGLSQREISKILDLGRIQVQRVLDSAYKKVNVATPKAISAQE